MNFASALEAARSRPSDPDALFEVARTALREGEEERALDALESAMEHASSGRLWQWKGLLQRALDEHEQALASFQTAARLLRADGSIAHGLARVALEAGIPSEHLFVRARQLAPTDGSVLLGLTAARMAAGRGEQAESELDALLRESPLWVEGHRQLAQLRALLGKPELASASIERALRQSPGQASLWQALFDLRTQKEDFPQLDSDIDMARNAMADEELLRVYEAIAAAEQGDTDRADRLFAGMDGGGAAKLPVWLIRHCLRTGRVEQALSLIDQELKGPRSADTWPYAAIAWRMTGDDRWDWLNRGGKLIAVVDLGAKLPPIERLADCLRAIHTARANHLDQSARGGTQTDGPLFSRIEPEIRALRSAVVDAVEEYVAQLPTANAGHPLLSRQRNRRVRFAGSWSVRLRQQGFHVPHVHPQGWISSALYVSVPPGNDSGSEEGWLQIGQPRRELGVGLEPLSSIKPEPGRLVLFPSWMWHGTNPFPTGERMSVAFDVAPPR